MKVIRKIWEKRVILLITGSVAIILVAIRWTGWLQALEWAALDQFFRMRPQEPSESRIVIVRIEETDLEKLGQWPFSDAVLAKLLLKIKAQKPRAIGLDLYRNLPVNPGTKELKKVLDSTPNLIGVDKKIGTNNSKSIEASPALQKLGQVGFNDVVVDGDGKLRRSLLFLTTNNGETSMSLALRLAIIYLKAEGIKPKSNSVSGNLQLGKAEFVPFEVNDGGYINADAGGYQIIINYQKTVFHTVSLSEVLEGRIGPDIMRDRIVLIGPFASSLKDFFYTPYTGNLINAPPQTPGVEIQAHTISHILSAALSGRPAIEVWPEWLEVVWIFLWSGVGASLSWRLRSQPFTIPMLFLAAGSLIGGAYLLFLGGWWIPTVPPLMALSASAIFITGYIAQTERKDRQIVMNLFGRYVSPKIAEAIWQSRDQILKHKRIKGQKVTATVLFTDIQGFSTIAEKIDPEILMSWLDEYMAEMTQLVLAYGGIVDKFIGDAIMAVFGVLPFSDDEEKIILDALAAVLCAVAMAVNLKSLNQRWLDRNLPNIQMRVGIATGSVVVGSIGSHQRKEYTTIGDTVNVASRLESYDKSIDGGICRILINEQTYQYVKGLFSIEFVGNVLLKGRSTPMNVYRVLID